MPRVLVVDDAAFMRMRAAKALQDHGYDVLQAENGVEAVKIYQAERPDAVLMGPAMLAVGMVVAGHGPSLARCNGAAATFP